MDKPLEFCGTCRRVQDTTTRQWSHDVQALTSSRQVHYTTCEECRSSSKIGEKHVGSYRKETS